jgi:hypothetical protein
MNQNSIIAFALLVGFIVFVTMRGELSQYLAVIGLSNATLPASGGASPVSTAGAPYISSLLSPGLVPAPSVGPTLSLGAPPSGGSFSSLIG